MSGVPVGPAAWRGRSPIVLPLLLAMSLAVGPAPVAPVASAAEASLGPSALPSPAPDLTALQARILQLEAENAVLSGELPTLTTERDRLRAAADGFTDLYDPMEADRLLLLELRKDLPDTRPEAEAYLARIEKLSLISDPARLGPVAGRVMEAAPVYLDWRDQDFATQEEADLAYIQSGASGFDTTWRAFRDALLLTVASRLDAVLSLLDRTVR